MGMKKNAGRSRSSNAGVGGSTTTVTTTQRQHGGAGRDARLASNAADYGNQVTGNPSARAKSRGKI